MTSRETIGFIIHLLAPDARCLLLGSECAESKGPFGSLCKALHSAEDF